MKHKEDQGGQPAPLHPIRRFDVFAEFTRQERRDDGYPADEAKGYGIWLAKVVAARRFGKTPDAGDHDRQRTHRKEKELEKESKFRSLSDELQTDETFDHDIIERMGGAFYRDVFVPSIEQSRSKGESYEVIRDSIRKAWKPANDRTR